MSDITQCSGNRIPLQAEEKKRVEVLDTVLARCSPWRLVSKTAGYLGAGSFGSVYDVVLKKKTGSAIKMALKLILIGDIKVKENIQLRDETVKEIYYGRLMSKANIGPRVYDEFLYTENDCACSNLPARLFGVILMEKFQGSGSAFIWSNPMEWTRRKKQPWGSAPTLKARGIVIRKMMNLTRRMIYKDLYCWDIKPGNFVVNITKSRNIKVRMIDFGGQFCIFGVKERDTMFKRMKDSAVDKKIAAISLHQFNDIFYNIIMLPFIWIINNMWTVSFKPTPQQKKDSLLFTNMLSRVTQPFFTKICKSSFMRNAMVVLLISEPLLFKQFSHYTGGDLHYQKKSPQPSAITEYFGFVLDTLCKKLLVSHRKTRKRLR